jgi:signal transduction histidine kinase
VDLTSDWLALIDPEVRSVLERVRSNLSGRVYVPRGLEVSAAQKREGVRNPSASPVYDEADRDRRIVLQDVTRLLRFDELKNNLVATVAHELRTPLTSMRMAIHLCTEGAVGPLTPKQADLLFAAREDCDRLQTIVDELLDASRLQEGRPAPRKKAIAAEELVQAIAAHGGSGNGLELRAECFGSATCWRIPERIQLVFRIFSPHHFPPPGWPLQRALRSSGWITSRSAVPASLLKPTARSSGSSIETQSGKPGRLLAIARISSTSMEVHLA